jgi:carbamoyltransferase
MRKHGEELNPKHENIASSLQVVTEIIMHLLQRLHDRTKCANVCLTGGVAMNSVANGKVTRQTPFERAYVPAGAADNGTSFGAAFNSSLSRRLSLIADALRETNGPFARGEGS